MEDLMDCDKSEFDQFYTEVKNARNATQRVCANIVRCQDARGMIEKQLEKLNREQKTQIGVVSSQIRSCNTLISMIENLKMLHGETKIRVIKTSEILDEKQVTKTIETSSQKIDADAARVAVGTSKEELDALAALDSVENLFDTSQDDRAAKAKSGHDFDDEDEDDAKKKEKKKKKKKQKLVWDPRIRGYIKARTGDDEDAWRN